MTTRLTPDQRRTQIVQTAYAMIARSGPRGLSLRSIARECGISAPGLIYHFPTMSEVMREVWQERARRSHAVIKGIVTSAGERLTLVGLADALVQHFYVEHADETRRFDALEIESFSPDHPAHQAMARSVVEPMPLTRMLAEREFRDPEAAIVVLGLLADAMRARWMRDFDASARWAEWVNVRTVAMRNFARRTASERPETDRETT